MQAEAHDEAKRAAGHGEYKILDHELLHQPQGASAQGGSDRQLAIPCRRARELQVDTGAMTRMLDRLEAKGLCKRVRSTVDRRVVHLELTPAGRRVADKVPAVLADVLNDFLSGFSKTELGALKDSLRRMLANAESLRNQAPES